MSRNIDFQTSAGASWHWRFVRLLLRVLCRRLVLQGPTHKANITEYYRVMREAARHEFREDNDVTLDTFLRECHDEANNRSEPTARTAS